LTKHKNNAIISDNLHLDENSGMSLNPGERRSSKPP
jgi:hypothetical protein